MRDLRIGDRVRTPAGVGVVMRPIGREGQPPLGYCVGYADREFWLDHDAASVEPLPDDIPRERVADLHAAVCKRVEQIRRLQTTAPSFAREELETFAESLRLLLDVDDE